MISKIQKIVNSSYHYVENAKRYANYYSTANNEAVSKTVIYQKIV